MSNNIYNILNTLNALEAKYTAKPVETPKAKTQLQESMDQVLAEKYMGFKKTVAAVKKGGSAENPEAVAAAIGRKKYGKEKFQKAAAAGKKLGEGEVEESGLQAYLGNKKYGKDGMDALRKAGREGASKEKMAKIRAKHDKMDEDSDAKITKTPTGFAVSAPAGKRLSATLDKDGKIKPTDVKVIPKSDDGKKDDNSKDDNSTVKEVAPPGARAERMVKHIKKGYAKDGKITPKEKSIAYATAWKAHNKGKVEEAIKAMYKAGFTKEQIVEGWDDMMKAVAARRDHMKTGEKRQGAKGEIEKTATGVKHTRRYDLKSGETETGSDGQQVKRGRGRPKKSKFESATKINKMIAEHFREFIEGSIQGGVWTSDPPKKGQPFVPVPQNPDGGSVNPAPKPKATQSPQKPQPTPPMGTIKGGVWTSDPPKKGEVGVPVPVPVDEHRPPEFDMGAGKPAVKMPRTRTYEPEPEFSMGAGQPAPTAPPSAANMIGQAIGGTAGMISAAPRAMASLSFSPSNSSNKEKQSGGDSQSFKGGIKKGWNDTNPVELLKRMNATNEDQPNKTDSADMEEGNEFSGALDAARDAGEKTFKVNGKTYPVKEDQELLQMLRIAGIKVMEDTKVDEDDMEEGNEFSGELAKAKAAGAKEFKVDGKTYPVKEDAQLEECGMSPMGNGMMGQEEQEGKMNINTSMDSDGHKSVTVSADGNAALELMQMLKLAGMGGNEMSREQPQGVMVVSTGDDEEELSERMPLPNLGPDGQPNPADMQKLQQARASREQMSQELTKQQAWNTAKPETLKPSTSNPATPPSMEVPTPRLPQKPVDVPEEKEVDEAKDERYHANTTPEEHIMPVQVQTKGGDGDVAGREKKMEKHGYKFSDNPLAMHESMSLRLIKEYEGIKVKK